MNMRSNDNEVLFALEDGQAGFALGDHVPIGDCIECASFLLLCEEVQFLCFAAFKDAVGCMEEICLTFGVFKAKSHVCSPFVEQKIGWF